MNSLTPIAQEQTTALQILQTSNSIATPEQLAAVLKDKSVPRYYQLEPSKRLMWMGEQISALNYMAHSAKMPTEFDLVVESKLTDQAIMDDETIRGLALVEMQEAFRRGISREYGDFFGITAGSLVGFLRAYRTGPKRMKAIAILYKEEKEREAQEQRNLDKLMYEAKLKGFKMPFWSSTRGRKKTVTPEESEAHRKKIEQQREQILKNQNDDKH